MHFSKNKHIQGSMLILVLVATGLFMALTMGAISLALLQQKLNIKKVSKTQALHIAEAGANYYRWVLYHDHNDYCNGEACKPAPDYGPYGPYSYTDIDNNVIGSYELYIIPPATNGSTIVKIKAVGWNQEHPNITRTVEVSCGIPAWSTYSTLSNSNVRFGAGTEVWGPIHSNGGIRFDGVAHNLVSSSLLEYTDPDHASPVEFGVHTHAYEIGVYDPNELSDGSNPPTPLDYNSIFMAGRDFPRQTISFDLLTNYVNEALALATSDGLVLPSSGAEGYHITLKTDDTIDIKTVTSITPFCRYRNGPWINVDTLGIVTETNHMMGINTPANGLIFAKDRVWVDGIIDGNRVTILAFDEPLGGSVSDIIINNDLSYTNFDGSDSIGLIAQRDISIGLFSDNDLRIDAALIAKEGRVGRNYFPCNDLRNCSSAYCSRSSITLYGSIASRNRYGFAWSDGTGYSTRNLNYDNDLTYAPPPHFPTTGEYTFISWDEQ